MPEIVLNTALTVPTAEVTAGAIALNAGSSSELMAHATRFATLCTMEPSCWMMGITAPAIWATICPIGAMISARAATICMMIGMSACITAFSGGSRVVIMLRIGWISALTTSSSGGSTVDTRLTMSDATCPMTFITVVMTGMRAWMMDASGGSRLVISVVMGGISDWMRFSTGGSTVDTRLTMTVTTWPMASPITVMTGAIAEMMDDTAGSRLAISVVMGGNRD